MLFFYRWIRYEEAVEEGGKRWSKPHVASLMMEALQDLQSMLSTCPFILDCTAMSMLDVAGGCLSDFDWCIVVLFSLWQSVHIHYRNKAEWMKHAFKRIRIGITLFFFTDIVSLLLSRYSSVPRYINGVDSITHYVHIRMDAYMSSFY